MADDATKGEAVTIAWKWPAEQLLSYKVTPGEPGGLMNAAMIAKQLLAISKLMEAPEDGHRWKVALRGIYTHSDGTIQFDLVVMPAAMSQAERNEENPA